MAPIGSKICCIFWPASMLLNGTGGPPKSSPIPIQPGRSLPGWRSNSWQTRHVPGRPTNACDLFRNPAIAVIRLRCLQRTAVDNDGLAGAEAGLHQIKVGFGDILRITDPADREAGAD